MGIIVGAGRIALQAIEDPSTGEIKRCYVLTSARVRPIPVDTRVCELEPRKWRLKWTRPGGEVLKETNRPTYAVFKGRGTDEEIESIDECMIATYDPDTGFLEKGPEVDVEVCELPPVKRWATHFYRNGKVTPAEAVWWLLSERGSLEPQLARQVATGRAYPPL